MTPIEFNAAVRRLEQDLDEARKAVMALRPAATDVDFARAAAAIRKCGENMTVAAEIIGAESPDEYRIALEAAHVLP